VHSTPFSYPLAAPPKRLFFTAFKTAMPAKWDKKRGMYTTSVADMPAPKETKPTPIKIAVVNKGTPIRIALALEALVTFAFATYLLVFPQHAVSQLATTPKYAGPLAETLVQFFAMISYGMVLALAAGIPNTAFSVNLRSPIYIYIAASETLLIGLFSWLEYSSGQHLTGVKEPIASFLSWNFVAMVGWRVFVLTIVPEWFGSVEVVNKTE
jgi:hypothetical protein